MLEGKVQVGDVGTRDAPRVGERAARRAQTGGDAAETTRRVASRSAYPQPTCPHCHHPVTEAQNLLGDGEHISCPPPRSPA